MNEPWSVVDDSGMVGRLRPVRTHAEFSAELPAHYRNCLGCGPDNPHGHHLRARRDGRGVSARHVFDERHVGAPGIAHGGAVATVIDDIYGYLLYVVDELAVTRHLEIDYLKPVRLGAPYTLRADLLSRQGRKLHLQARVEDADGRAAATSTALFIVVGIEHFASPPTSARDLP
jgi:uncharacterized protein (TIGR00369 family)